MLLGRQRKADVLYQPGALKTIDAFLQVNLYYSILSRHPMDLFTAERKLNSSNPQMPNPNPNNPRYLKADEPIDDIHLMVRNAITVNGADYSVSNMGKNMELVFDRQLKHLPPTEVCVCLYLHPYLG
jgi:hypothetical protein